MQRKEGTAGHIDHTHKVRDAAVRAAGPNPPMYRRPHCGLLPRQSHGHGPLGGGGGLLNTVSGLVHVDLYAETAPSVSCSPGAPRATPPHFETGSS